MTDKQKEATKEGIDWFLKSVTPILLGSILAVFGYFGKAGVEKISKMADDIVEIKMNVNTQSGIQNQLNLNQMQTNVQLERRIVSLEAKK